MKKDTRNYEKKRKRKIFLSILMILFVAIVLTASTYAWFTSNQTVTVNQIDVSVAASNGLQISTDAEVWKTVITNDDIVATTTGTGSNYSTNENMIPFKSYGQIIPVSTAGGIGSAGKLAFFAGTLQNNATTGDLELTATAETETKGTTGHFVAFDLFFKVDTTSQVYLTPSSNVVAFDSNDDRGLKNAARVAWLREGSGGFEQSRDVWQGYKATTTTDAHNNPDNNLIIWEPNSETHTAAGTLNARLYGYNSTAVNALDYWGVKAAISTPVGVNDRSTTYFQNPVTGLLTTTNASGVPAGTQWFRLTAGVTKVRFYLWIEGQDVDCENSASGSSISYNMQFSLLNS